MASYVIWGSAGHAKVLANLIRIRGSEVVALFDNDSDASPALPGIPLYIGKEGFERWWASKRKETTYHAAVAIGRGGGSDRVEIQEFLSRRGLIFEPIIHPKAEVCATAQIGPGSQILAGAVVASECVIGKACIMNHRASIDHECVIDNGVHVAPGATLCGAVMVGDNVLIGAGAVVLPSLRVGRNTIVGAGAVVTRDLPPDVVAAGVPARVVRLLLEKSQER